MSPLLERLKANVYLGLRQAQFGCQVGPLGQGEVLGLLEALVEGLKLQAGVDGARLPDLLPLPVEPHFPVFYHRGGLLVLWRGEIDISTGLRTAPPPQMHQSQCLILTRQQEQRCGGWKCRPDDTVAL